MEKIRVGIVGYGNVGRGVEKAVKENPDMELVAVFTRRDPASLSIDTPSAKVYKLEDAFSMTDEIDVMVLCGGSATDLAVQGPQFAAHFNTVDSFDTHAKIPAYYATLDAVAKKTTAIMSTGWDPGLFSMMRVLSGAVLPNGSDYTFWGRGVSQGHSDAIRRIPGVQYAIQYTVPIDAAVEAVRAGRQPQLTTREKHTRECYVVAEEGADRAAIEQAIVTMPNYFDEYNTTVTFLDKETFLREHREMPHGGMVLRSGVTGDGHNQIIEFDLTLDSNPEFTGSVLAAYARAAYRLAKEGSYGVKTVLDVPLAYLAAEDRMSLIAHLL